MSLRDELIATRDPQNQLSFVSAGEERRRVPCTMTSRHPTIPLHGSGGQWTRCVTRLQTVTHDVHTDTQ